MIRFFVAIHLFKTKPRQDLLDLVHSRFRVRLWDLDANIHMNNVRYMKYLERARVDFIVRTPWLQIAHESNVKSLIANVTISYVKELKPFQPFEVCTRISSWDDRYIYIEQRFMHNNQIYTSASARMAFVDRTTKQRISPNKLFSQVDLHTPASPASVYHFNQLIKSQRQESELVLSNMTTNMTTPSATQEPTR